MSGQEEIVIYDSATGAREQTYIFLFFLLHLKILDTICKINIRRLWKVEKTKQAG